MLTIYPLVWPGVWVGVNVGSIDVCIWYDTIYRPYHLHQSNTQYLSTYIVVLCMCTRTKHPNIFGAIHQQPSLIGFSRAQPYTCCHLMSLDDADMLSLIEFIALTLAWTWIFYGFCMHIKNVNSSSFISAVACAWHMTGNRMRIEPFIPKVYIIGPCKPD